MASIGALPGMRERTITVNGFSKGFAMTGWRLGYAAAVEPIAKAMARMQSTITTGANQFVQRAAIAALEGPRDEVEAHAPAATGRGATWCWLACGPYPGVRIGDIPATFYAFPDVSALLGRKAGNHVIDTTDALCDWLLEEHGVATVPGTAFGAPGSIRLSFAASEADIQKALDGCDDPGALTLSLTSDYSAAFAQRAPASLAGFGAPRHAVQSTSRTAHSHGHACGGRSRAT